VIRRPHDHALSPFEGSHLNIQAKKELERIHSVIRAVELMIPI